MPYDKVGHACPGFVSTAEHRQGANFLLHLERTVGGLDHFLPYMKDYVKTFNGYSITTEQWRQHLFHFFGNQLTARSTSRLLARSTGTL